MSNKKLTTEEKIAKSKLYAENMEKTQNRLKDMREAKRKLDAEIAEELEKAYIVNMQELGKHTAGKIGEGFSLDEYAEIVDCIFTLDEVTDYVKSEREKQRMKAENEKAANDVLEDETACSDADCISA
ncbi:MULTISPECIES: hypothetical protein [unclassified Ruminococcus]|uniref:hypothetical protein n=1 Tax=unclassified Ruminococcus TaxID=2608920 RepID=UPI00093176EB|nr:MULTISPECIES: hypothetical protein [unclassified Ruminococcus]